MNNETSGTIDESLYSRQLYVLGRRAMERMTGSKGVVLISGMGGLGVEVAKNIILAGVPSVTLHDPHPVQWNDLSCNFYLEPPSEGGNVEGQDKFKESSEWELPNRNICDQAAKLGELNPNVNVKVISEPQLTPEVLQQNNVSLVVLCDGFCSSSISSKSSGRLVLELADFCHREKISLILAETRGLFARVFCDFGPEFVVEDPLGEETTMVLIQKSKFDPTMGTVTCYTGQRHGLQNSDAISILRQRSDEVTSVGSVTIQSPRIFEIAAKDIEGVDLRIDLTSTHFIKVKRPLTMNFDRLSDSMENPRFAIPDYAKPEHPIQIHSFFQALDRFIEETGQSPQNKNEEHFQKFFKIAQSCFHKAKNLAGGESSLTISEKLARQFAQGCDGQLSPMCAFIGGVVGQEVMKAVTRKFKPLDQWLFYDASECLYGIEESWTPTGESGADVLDKSDPGRFSGQIAVFGPSFQELVNNARVFVVGAGAIGCELLKNFALMGVGSGPKGKVVVTDMDSIERSNLSRQFLFRNHDVGKQKSVTAAEAVRKINPRINIEAHCLKVGAMESDNVFNDEFYQGLDIIVSAVDNLTARTLMDQTAIDHLIPLLDSGTHGTKGSVQVVIPNLTSNYGATPDPVTHEIPLCTLKFFPSAIEHTIQWARELFEQEFTVVPQNFLKFYKFQGCLLKNGSPADPFQNLAVNEKHAVFKEIEEFTENVPTSFVQCIEWAWRKFFKLYGQDVQDLLQSHPADSLTADGSPFWTKDKLCPQPLSPVYPFHYDDDQNALFTDFVLAAANLKASLHNIPQERNEANIREICNNLLTNVAFESLQISATNQVETAKNFVEISEDSVSLLKNVLEARTRNLTEVFPLEFEKDSYSNFHVDFITAASNLRAKVYGIPQADRFRTKQIVGRIIPAISTTTSVVGGLTCLELYKVIQYNNRRKHSVMQTVFSRTPFKSSFVNLALPLVTFTFPCKPRTKSVEIRSETSVGSSDDDSSTISNFSFNVWSRFEVPPDHRTSGTLDPLNSVDRTLEGFLAFMKKEHFLKVTGISHGPCIIYADYLGEENLPFMKMPIEQVVKELLENADILRGKSSLKLTIVCDNVENTDGDPDVCLPPVFYYLPAP